MQCVYCEVWIKFLSIWRRVVNLTSCRFSPGKERRYPLKAGWDPSAFWTCWRKYVFASTGIRVPDHPGRNLFNIPTAVSRLQFFVLTFTISTFGFLTRKTKGPPGKNIEPSSCGLTAVVTWVQKLTAIFTENVTVLAAPHPAPTASRRQTHSGPQTFRFVTVHSLFVDWNARRAAAVRRTRQTQSFNNVGIT